MKNVSCSNCRSIFICNREDLKLPDNADVNTYFDDNDFHRLEVRNRGGLKYPSSFSFNIVAVAYCIFMNIRRNTSSHKQLFYSSNIVTNLSQFCADVISNSPDFSQILKKVCDSDQHVQHFTMQLLQHVFNVFLKNFVKNANDDKNSDSLKKKKIKLSCSTNHDFN